MSSPPQLLSAKIVRKLRPPSLLQRIALIAPTLEPGRSGVGDYTFRLAGELKRRGISVLLIGLHDPWLNEPVVTHGELMRGRFPAHLDWKEKGKRVAQLLRQFSPDLLSLQFVTYGYHSYGLPWRAVSLFRRYRSAVPLELMLHELWSGARGISPAALRRRLLGVMQKQLLLRMVSQLKPTVLHTQAVAHAKLLHSAGLASKILPLVPTVERIHSPAPERRSALLRGLDLPQEATPERLLILTHFGTVHPEWNEEALSGWLEAGLRRVGKRGVVLAIGGSGTYGEQLWNRWSGNRENFLFFRHRGRIPAEEVSEWLHLSDYGLTSHPPDLVDKSSAAVAMFDHGLPVIATRPPVLGREIVQVVKQHCPLLVCEQEVQSWYTYHKEALRESTLPRTAEQFLADLQINLQQPFRK